MKFFRKGLKKLSEKIEECVRHGEKGDEKAYEKALSDAKKLHESIFAKSHELSEAIKSVHILFGRVYDELSDYDTRSERDRSPSPSAALRMLKNCQYRLKEIEKMLR